MAGTIGMVLGAAIFVVFAVPVSSMLRGAAEPDGLFQDEDCSFMIYDILKETTRTHNIQAMDNSKLYVDQNAATTR